MVKCRLYLNYKLVIVLNNVEQLNLGNFNKYSKEKSRKNWPFGDDWQS